MDKIEVTSSNLKYVAYDEASKQLQVGFEAPETNLEYARVYKYYDLPLEVYQALMTNPSKGEYLCKYIAFEYSYEYMGLEGELK